MPTKNAMFVFMARQNSLLGNIATTGNLVTDGDSETAGQGFTPYPNFLTTPGWTITNIAVSGERLSTELPLARTKVDPLYSSAKPNNICVIWMGTNDIGSGHAPSDVYNLLIEYIQQRHAVGWKVVTATMLSRVIVDTQKDAYNALIIANTAGADAIVNFTNTVLGCDGCYANTILFQNDGIHPTQAGANIEVPLFQAAINSLIQ